MKKLMLIAAACVALASCVKNEVEPFVNESPISFQAVQGMEQTRADYAKDVPFAASAFLLDVSKGETWAADGETADVEPYFLLQTVTWNVDPTNAPNKWTTAAPYYWPIQDKLVFFAHSPATVTASIDATSKAYTFADYDVDAVKNQDLMVATVVEAGYDKTTNEVPVKFNHKLTKISFKVKTADGYPTNKTIAVNKIVITGLSKEGTLVLDKVGDPVTPVPAEANWTKKIGWKGQGTPTAVEYVYFEGSQAISGETAITKGASAQEIFLPQSFVGNDNAKVIVDYTITTDLGGGLTATEEVTDIPVQLNAGTPTAWEMNKHITYVISVAPGKRILWAQPTIEDWETETGSLAI